MFGPLACLIVGVSLILFLILVLRFHAFLALILAALSIAILSNQVPLNEAVPLVTKQFGAAMGGLGILLVLAAIIGKCMMDSGAADRIVRAFNRLFGEGREEFSLFASGFALSIPVFFDTVFYLLAPLARAAYARRKRDYVLLVTMTAAGGAVTHALIPPTPGPILVAEALGVSILTAMWVGFLASLVPTFFGAWLYSSWINKHIHAEPKDMLGMSQTELEATASKPDSELPSLFFSCVPFLLPVVLLAGSTFFGEYVKTNSYQHLVQTIPSLSNVLHKDVWWLALMGDKNMVFFIGAAFGIWLLVSSKKQSLNDTFKSLESAIASGAVIAFITCAGGAFGKSLAAAGVGTYIASGAETWGISLMALAFFCAALMRVAQGSATVAMVTTAGIIAPVLQTTTLSYHPAYLVAVIGFAATAFSWMNDSGFWIFGQMTGLTERQTLQTWTATLSLMGILGAAWVWLLSSILPLV
ncbi:GntP family permease [bacterium]|nr:GntP family permease [bacterium]